MIGAGHFASTPIRSPAGHALSYDETQQRLAPVLERVPITRVYDATPLDWLGLPVWAAVTPLAVDLTVHAGKGPTPDAARISAVMEAIERVCAESVADGRIRRASFAEMRRGRAGALDPELFDLPFGTAYRPDRPLSWIRGYDLIAERHAWVPLDLVTTPAREGICSGVETNGLAAGNNHTEAALHALHELVERDALAHNRFARLYAEDGQLPAIRVIDRATLPPVPANWARRLRDRGLRVAIQDLSHDLDVPVFRTTIYDSSFPGREDRATTFEGMGADLDPAWAVSRAIAEAVQSHTVMVLGARDSVEDSGRHARLDKRAFLRRLATPSRVDPFPAATADLPSELRARLQILLDRVAAVGLRHCVAVDLTREDLGIPVLRLLVPGLAGPLGDTTRRPTLRLLRTLVREPAPKLRNIPPGPRELAARGPDSDLGGFGSAKSPSGVGPPRSHPTTTRAAGDQLRVFTGPSLAPDAVAAALPVARVEAPIARGDLARLSAEGTGTFLILDGAFAHRLAVSPSEIVDAIAGGARIIGAASIGAIRAAECWPAGMDGVGAVYRLYRLGMLRDDDEVAVATDPDRGFAAVSVALVSVRYAALAALRAGLLNRAGASAVLAAARQTHFADRRWRTIFSTAGVELGDELRTLCEGTDVKRRDAVAAVQFLANEIAAGRPAARGEFVGSRFVDGSHHTLPSTRRRTPNGFSPHFGYSLPALQRELASWLLDSGRYSRYFGTATPALSDGPGLGARIWEELMAIGAVEHELMHWHAVQRVAAYS